MCHFSARWPDLLPSLADQISIKLLQKRPAIAGFFVYYWPGITTIILERLHRLQHRFRCELANTGVKLYLFDQ